MGAFFDQDLSPVLRMADNQDLEFLVNLLQKQLTSTLGAYEAYKKHHPNHRMYADAIAAELCEFGGNSFANLCRGQGPAYQSIVCDVAAQLKAPYNKKQSAEMIEDSILRVVLEKALERMSDEEKRELLKASGGTFHFSAKGAALTAAVIALFRAGGFKSYQITVILVSAIAKAILGHGLAFGTMATITYAASIMVGPVGWALTGIWTAVDIAGPAYRVTTPAVLYVAMLRKKIAFESGQGEKECIQSDDDLIFFRKNLVRTLDKYGIFVLDPFRSFVNRSYWEEIVRKLTKCDLTTDEQRLVAIIRKQLPPLSSQEDDRERESD